MLERDADAEDHLPDRPYLEEPEQPERHDHCNPAENHGREPDGCGERPLEDPLPAVGRDEVAALEEREPPQRHQHRRHQRVRLEVVPPAVPDDREEDDREER